LRFLSILIFKLFLFARRGYLAGFLALGCARVTHAREPSTGTYM
jgi:hypothetical protein